MIELAEKVLQLDQLGSRASFTSRCPRDDPKQRRPDITLAQAKLGWEPKVALDDGLKETVAYFRKLLGA